MVYCKLKERNADGATYFIGSTINDMTGEVTFFKNLREPELIRQPNEERVTFRHLAKLYGKYKNDFSAGNFKEKLAIEIG